MLGAEARLGARGAHPRRGAHRAILEAQLGEPDGAASTRTGRERDLDRPHLGDRAAAGRTPRELELARADDHRLPVRGQRKRLLAIPPDVLAAGGRELDLQSVPRTGATEREAERPGLRQCQGQLLAGDDEAAAAGEVEVETHGLAVGAGVVRDVEPGEAGCHRPPAREIAEVVAQEVRHAHPVRREP
jgi:hypothetical protein